MPTKKPTFAERVGKNLLDLRTKKGVSLREAAKKSGCGLRSICRWEAGTDMPTSNSMAKLAKYYGIDPSEILA